MEKVNKIIKLSRVRLSYPSLYKPSEYEKYGANFILDKNDPFMKKQIAYVQKTLELLLKERFGTLPKSFESCLVDSDTDPKVSEQPEYKNTYFLRARSPRLPFCLNHNGEPVLETDNVLYAGCYVDTTVQLYAWDHKNKKQACCDLRVVRFNTQGEKLTTVKAVDYETDFDLAEGISEDTPLG